VRPLKAVSSPPRRGEFVTRRLNGGLNYGFTYGLTASELIDGGDFDLSESGAVGSRRAMKPYTTTPFDQEVLTSWAWEDKAGNDYLFAVLADGEIVVCTNGAASFGASVFGTMTDVNSRCTPHAWSAGGWLYVSDGYKVWRWGGAGYIAYDDVTTVFIHPVSITPEATNLGVPPNVAATTYQSMVFVANTLIWATDPDSVAWSLPVAEQPEGSPLEHLLTGQEDFFENRRITFIEGSQADSINKLVSAGPNLYAFKRHSIHGLGFSGTTVLANDISTNLGLAGPEAVAVQGADVWFFDEHEGLHVISGGAQPVKVFDPIYPLLDCARITRPWLTAVGVDGDQVFVSVCLDNDEAGFNNVTFVLNTKLSATSRGGAWSKWDVGFSSFLHWMPQNGDSSLLGFTSQFRGDTLGHPWACLRLNECSTAIVDDYGGGTTRPILPWFRTAFFDDNLPSLRKRWNRVWMTLVGSDVTKLDVYANVSPVDRRGERCDLPASGDGWRLIGRSHGTVNIDLTPLDEDGDEMCDTDSSEISQDLGRVRPSVTAGEGTVAGRVQRIVSPGRGVAFSLEVRDAGSEAAWEVDGMGVKYDAIVDFQ
jgi:hypothetical protein